MKLTEIDHGLDLAKPSAGYVRSPGLHMSDIYNDLYRELNPARYDKRDKDGNPLPFDSTRAEFGTAFEEVLEDAMSGRLLGARPGEERTPEGIIYSPDHYLFNGQFRLGEFKATWMSSRYGLHDPRFDKWFTQMKSYCHNIETPYARLYSFFVNGDYTTHQPQLRAWDIEFSGRELRDNWDMMMRHARKRGMLP